MRFFFLYWSTIISSFYLFSTVIDGIWVPIFNIFFALSITAANVSLFRKKVGAAMGLGIFSFFLIPAIWFPIKVLSSLDVEHWEILWVPAFSILVFCSVYFSYKGVFRNKELSWNESSIRPHILKIILVLIQLILGWIVYSHS